jgi:hypothetical protein
MHMVKITFACAAVMARAAVFGVSLLMTSEAAATDAHELLLEGAHISGKLRVEPRS